MSDYGSTQFPPSEAYREGRRAGLAIGALAASLVAFISLLGIEKAILAVALALLALRQAPRRSAGRKTALAAIVVACVYTVVFIVVIVVFREKLAGLLRQLQQLG